MNKESRQETDEERLDRLENEKNRIYDSMDQLESRMMDNKRES